MTVSLYVALTIFALGMVYKVSTWFRYNMGPDSGDMSSPARVIAASKGIRLTLLSERILTLLKVFVLDVLFQLKVFRQDSLKWPCICACITALCSSS
jgi:hypothetical protein